jgi:hypothetical protein
MAQAASTSYWLSDTLPFTVCAVYYERVDESEAVFLAAPCAESIELIGSLPGLVVDLCANPPWGNKSHAAFCLDGITRYHAAGLLLDVDPEAAPVLAEILYFNDHLVAWTNEIMQNVTLYAEEEWRGAIWKFLHHVRWLRPCLDARPFLVMLPVLPETVCGRPINVYGSGNNTEVLDLEVLQARWTALYESSPCVGRETIIVLNGVMDPYCGELLPLIRDAVDGFAGEVDWDECGSRRGFLALGLGDSGVGAWVCGVELAYPSHPPTAQAWENVRNHAACAGEVSFILYPAGDAPDWLCGAPVEVVQPFEAVFAYVEFVDPCGSDTALLIVGGEYENPVVVCGEEVGDLGGSWSEDWAVVAGSNPCGGEVVFLAANRTEGRLCRYDFQVNLTAWQRVHDAVAGAYCQGSGEVPLVALGLDVPLVACGEALPKPQAAEPYWAGLAAAWNACGNQLLLVQANETFILGPASLCGVEMLRLAEFLEEFAEWEDVQERCSGRFRSGSLSPLGLGEVCGINAATDPGVADLLHAMTVSSPCGAGEHFLLGFGTLPVAVCGGLFADLRTIFASLEGLMSDAVPCGLDAVGGSAFCGLQVPDHEEVCSALIAMPGLCGAQEYGALESPVVVGYPWIVNETALWFLGGPEFAHVPACGAAACDEIIVERLRGSMTTFAPPQVSVAWRVEVHDRDGQIQVGVPSWEVSGVNLLLAEEIGAWPDRFDWRTPGIGQLLENGQEIPLGDIPNFPFDLVDDPTESAPLPYMKIRPGLPHYSDSDYGRCTLNFVFQFNGTGERWAIGGAGHCLPTIGGLQKTEIITENMTVPCLPIPLGQCVLKQVRLGKTILTTGGGFPDFGLIEVDEDLVPLLHAAIAVLDGPCGWRETVFPGQPDPIQLYGHNPMSGPKGQPRSGTVIDSAPSHLEYLTLPASGRGDSGAPIRFLHAFLGNGLEAAAVHKETGHILPNSTGAPELGDPFAGMGPPIGAILAMLNGGITQGVHWYDEDDIGKWKMVSSPTCAEFGLPPGP